MDAPTGTSRMRSESSETEDLRQAKKAKLDEESSEKEDLSNDFNGDSEVEVIGEDSGDDEIKVIGEHRRTDEEEVVEAFELDESTKTQLKKDFAAILDVTMDDAEKALQNHDWSMQSAIDDFLAATAAESGDGNVEPQAQNSRQQAQIEPEVANPTRFAPEKFSVISWNVDGLDDKNLEQRTQYIVDTIERENYSVVFLQELIPPTFHYIATKLQKKYVPILGTEDPDTEYFIATFLRKNHVIYVDHYIIPFHNSSMGRNLLVTKAFTGQAQLFFLNTHLESTADFASARIAQLKMCFEHCMSFPREANVIFGGDLNLRDKEVVSVLPREMFDVWVERGSRQTCQYTWDLTRNTNKQMPSRFQPRLRFDRLYCRLSTPQSIKPDFFGVTGLEKVPGTQSFPSDHWGIFTFFKLEENARKPADCKKE